MGRLLQRSGNATSLPYVFLPGNHEVGSCPLCKLPESLAPLIRDMVITAAAFIALAVAYPAASSIFICCSSQSHKKPLQCELEGFQFQDAA